MAWLLEMGLQAPTHIPALLTLDQESPGSSPGGAMATVKTVAFSLELGLRLEPGGAMPTVTTVGIFFGALRITAPPVAPPRCRFLARRWCSRTYDRRC